MCPPPSTPTPSPSDDAGHRHAGFHLLITTVFLVVAGWFLLGPAPDPPLLAAPADVSFAQVSTEPLRRAAGDPPVIEVAGFEFRCQECHRLFPSLPETNRVLMQHREIRLDHGLNDRCFNCHDNNDRSRLVLDGTETVGFVDAPQMCAVCHGPAYRDWQQGMHGRTNGFWDDTRGTPRRLVCSECHDPHAPAFAPMALLPGPDTLRMDRTRPAEHAATATDNPLRRWSRGQVPRSSGGHDRP